MFWHQCHAAYYMWRDNIGILGYVIEQVRLSDLADQLKGMKIVDEQVFGELIAEINARLPA